MNKSTLNWSQSNIGTVHRTNGTVAGFVWAGYFFDNFSDAHKTRQQAIGAQNLLNTALYGKPHNPDTTCPTKQDSKIEQMVMFDETPTNIDSGVSI